MIGLPPHHSLLALLSVQSFISTESFVYMPLSCCPKLISTTCSHFELIYIFLFFSIYFCWFTPHNVLLPTPIAFYPAFVYHLSLLFSWSRWVFSTLARPLLKTNDRSINNIVKSYVSELAVASRRFLFWFELVPLIACKVFIELFAFFLWAELV